MRPLMFLAVLFLSVQALAQPPQVPRSSVLDAFQESLRACAVPGSVEGGITSFCAGVRFGALDVYISAAEQCAATRSEEDCAIARSRKEYIESLLKSLSRR